MNLLIGNLVHWAANRYGDRDAMLFTGDRTLGFAEVDRLAGQLASGLSAQGVGRGDRVAIHLPNGWRWLVAYYAIARLG